MDQQPPESEDQYDSNILVETMKSLLKSQKTWT